MRDTVVGHEFRYTIFADFGELGVDGYQLLAEDGARLASEEERGVEDIAAEGAVDEGIDRQWREPLGHVRSFQ